MGSLLTRAGNLVVLIGAAGARKSSSAAWHFRRTEMVSSDFCCGLVSDDESN
jgi:predicted kinase